jgi:hypothetical protein
MTDLNTVDSLFDDSNTIEVESKEENTVETEVVEDEKDVNEAEEASEDKEEVSSTPEKTEKTDKTVPLSAMEAERKKRQAAEAKLREYEAKQGSTKEVEADEVEDDAELTIDDKLFHERVNMSREIMMEQKPDYEEKVKVFLKMAEENPEILNQYRKAQNPAKFAYEKGKKQVEFEEFESTKNSEEYKEFLKFKEERSKEPKADDKKATAMSLPKLNNATSKMKTSKVAEQLITKVDDLF